MNSLSLALKKANVVTDDDIERVTRQKKIEEERKRQEDERRHINKMINSLSPRVRNAVRHIRKINPEIMTIAVLEKLSAARQYPWLLLEADVQEAMGHVLIEKMRQDFEEARQKGDLDMPD